MASTTIRTKGETRNEPQGGEPNFLRRQIEIAGGIALFGVAAWLGLAFSTWTVSDPSLSQANGNPIHNMAGASGAVMADLGMQIFGLGAALLVALPAIWGLLLALGRPIDRIWRRAWFALAGIVLAAAAVGCFTPPPGWPLPVGLGGVAGDLVLKFPALATGDYPSGVIAMALAAMIAMPAGWLFLNGAALIDRDGTEPMLSNDRPLPAKVPSPAPRKAAVALPEEDDEEEDGAGRLALLYGAVTHTLYSARAALERRRSSRATARREPAEFGDRFDEWRDEDGTDAPPAPRQAQRAIKVTVPYQPRDYVDPLEDMVEDEAYDPRRDKPEPFQFDDRIGGTRNAPAAPLTLDGEDDHADEAFDDTADAEGKAFAQADDDSMIAAPGERIVPNHAPLPPEAAEDAGGWRGLAANIVAFPGKKRGKAEAPAPAPRPAAEPATRSPQPAARPAAPMDNGVRVVPAAPAPAPARNVGRASARGSTQHALARDAEPRPFELPPVDLLSMPKARARDSTLSQEALQDNARLLEGVLDDFGVKGEIIEVRPGPVVTLYELEPAPGIKSSRVIGLADDIARSMSAIAARVAVIPGKNAIGIELPNQRRETVYFREMIASEAFAQNKGKLALALGKTIGGEPVIADLAKMPHLLVAGTTGSGKSVSINTMILSLLYRMTPEQCRMIMIDPKMLELSVYDGIPHLLSPVVTDPKKAVVALKWTVREMEDRYRKMSKVGVRNIDGFNARVTQAIEKGETISRTVQTGFDRETGEPIFESEEFDLSPLPYIVVIIDEMADLMMVAGKEIEGTVQRLAQMARAAGIHVIMATQRPSVDVITGTIKANFPTRISFQVTSKIDSRTILQEQGAEQLLGMGDMLFMAGGGRIQRVHGPFVDDVEVEHIVAHLKSQGVPDYLDAILEEEDEDGGAASSGGSGSGAGEAGGLEESADLYDQAVAVVLRDGKASTSYVQRRLQIGYNRAASIIERMEREGIVGPANHAGKREILVPTEEDRG